MELPNLGKPGSILSILVPGTFLLFNIVVGVYFILGNETILLENISGDSLQIIVFLLLICIAYLLGAVLQLIKCGITDYLSGCCLKLFSSILEFFNLNGQGQSKMITDEEKSDFPYIKWIEKKCNEEYPGAKHFYDKLWGGQSSNKKGRSFLNFYKVILISVDENLANECYAAEAFNRYLSSIFYGLFLSCLIILLVLIKQGFSSNEELSLMLLGIEVFYFVAAFLIIWNYRYIRIKEVETVFAATFAAQEKFLSLLGEELSGELHQNYSTINSIDSAEI